MSRENKKAPTCALCEESSSQNNELLKNDDGSYICERCAETYGPY